MSKPTASKGKYQKKDFEKESLNKFQKEVGSIKNGEFVDVKVHVKKYGENWFVDLRQWMNKPNFFEGPLKKGFQIPFEDFEEFKEIINSIELNDYGNDKLPTLPEGSS